jgi:HEAT repeat protein
MSRRARPAASAIFALAAGCALGLVLRPPLAAGHEGQPAPRLQRDTAPPPRVTGGKTLRELLPQSTAVVLGFVSRTEGYDGDKLRLHRVRVSRTLRGEVSEPEIAIVEVRGASKRPQLVYEGMNAILLVRPAGTMSYLEEQLPPGTYWTVAGERDGVVLAASDTEVDALAPVIGRAAEAAVLSGDQAVAAHRALAFDEIRSRNARLVADGVLELERLPALEELDDAELEALGAALRDTTLPPRIRVGLVRLIAERDLEEALPALLSAEVDHPELLAAVLDTRARLGAPVPPDELRAHLESDDPEIRAAALSALGAAGDPAAIPELARFAIGDKNSEVRAAAVQALGRTKSPKALPTLALTFAEPDRELKQRSAQAILAIEGPEADNALVELALRGTSPEVRRHAALLLMVSRGPDHAAVRQLAAQNQDPRVRALLDEGLRFHHQHDHTH